MKKPKIGKNMKKRETRRMWEYKWAYDI